MLIKIAGMALAVTASTALGLYYSGIDAFRIQDLLEFKKALLILRSEIEYVATPLPEASAQIARRTEKPVNAFFAELADELSANGGETAYQIWASAVERYRKQTYMTAEDREALNAFGKTLGYLDKPMQLNAISFTIDYIDGKVSFLQTDCDKKKRMYRSLGVIGGILLAVIFV